MDQSPNPQVCNQSPGTWNRNNPSIRRILADIKELERDPSDQYAARPLEDNMFDWHFAIRGPVGTDFEGGVYHGRIILPSDYPFKPPNIVLLTPNGRWEVNQKICLSISAYHPEQWQPAWGIRTILEALISFMTAPADGAVGAVDYPPEIRRTMAKESLDYRHPLMPELPTLGSASENSSNKYKDEIAKMHIINLGALKSDAANSDESATISSKSSAESEDQEEDKNTNVDVRDSSDRTERAASGDRLTREAAVPHGTTTTTTTDRRTSASSSSGDLEVPKTDWLLRFAIFLGFLIFVILYRKAYRYLRTTVSHDEL